MLREVRSLLSGQWMRQHDTVPPESTSPIPTLEAIRSLGRPALEQVIRRHSKFWYLGDRTGMCHTLGDKLTYIDTSDFALTPHLIRDGFWEIWITMAMARVLKRGMTVVDVGANLGYYTLLMADAVGPDGRVLAFEPNPRLAQLAQMTMSVNGYAERSTIMQQAASAVSGNVVRFHIPAGRPMNAFVTDDRDTSDAVTEVTTARLDDVLPPTVDFIKIDVEGAEREVWTGLTRTITQNPKIQIFLEFNSARYGDSAPIFLEDICRHGFRLAYIDFDGTTTACDRDFVLSHGEEDIILHLAGG